MSQGLSRAVECGVCAMDHLAQQPDGESLSIGAICRAEHLSYSYVAKALTQLRAAGLIASDRGMHGGFYLLWRPEDISLLEIIEAIEGPVKARSRRSRRPGQVRSNARLAFELWSAGLDRLRQRLAAVTLAKLMQANNNHRGRRRKK